MTKKITINKETAYIKVSISKDGFSWVDIQICAEIIEKRSDGRIIARLSESGEKVIREFNEEQYSLEPLNLPFN